MNKKLAQGSFGEAFLMHRRKDGESVVVKRSHKTVHQMHEKEVNLVRDEAKFAIELGQKGCTFIIKGHEAFITPEGHICIVTEYADEGDLGQLQKQNPTEKQVVMIFLQMMLAVKFLHDQDILHRDLKFQNVFTKADGTVKVADFGLTK